MLQKYKQTTYETCLACSLLQAVDLLIPFKITKKEELKVINHSFEFSRDDFVIGHLDYIAKKFNVSIKRFVDNKYFYEWVKNIKSADNIKTKVEKINLTLINKLLEQKLKPILYVDSYYMFGYYHLPHFITILKNKDDKYKIFDTWAGKEETLDNTKLSKMIVSLRNHIKLCPQIIVVE